MGLVPPAQKTLMASTPRCCNFSEWEKHLPSVMSTENSAAPPITHPACKAGPFGKGVEVKYFNSPTILPLTEGSRGLGTHLGIRVPGSVPGMGGQGGEKSTRSYMQRGPLP